MVQSKWFLRRQTALQNKNKLALGFAVGLQPVCEMKRQQIFREAPGLLG